MTLFQNLRWFQLLPYNILKFQIGVTEVAFLSLNSGKWCFLVRCKCWEIQLRIFGRVESAFTFLSASTLVLKFQNTDKSPRASRYKQICKSLKEIIWEPSCCTDSIPVPSTQTQRGSLFRNYRCFFSSQFLYSVKFRPWWCSVFCYL